MRILHVLDSLDPRYGGPVRAVLDLSRHAIESNLQSEFAGFCEAPPQNSQPEMHLFPIAFPRHYRYAPGWREWLSANLVRFDGVVVHSMWCYWGWATALECRKVGVPYACFPHGMLEDWSVRGQGWTKRVKKQCYWALCERGVVAGSRAVLFTTKREMRLTCDAFKLSPVSLKVIPYGAEITRCDLPATLPDDMARLVEAKYALFLGRIHPKKNPELLLQAWSRGAPADWLLVIAGPAAPEYRQRLQTLARALGIESRVLFLEFTEGQRKAWLLEHARWFLLPSSQENFGVAVLEALLGGLPVVLSDQVAMAEELPSGSPVIEVAVECWANFFRVSMADEDYRERITAAQTRYAHEHFNITTLAAGWAATLRSIFA